MALSSPPYLSSKPAGLPALISPCPATACSNGMVTAWIIQVIEGPVFLLIAWYLEQVGHRDMDALWRLLLTCSLW